MSTSKWITINGVRYPNEENHFTCEETTAYGSSDNEEISDNEIDQNIVSQNKRKAKELYEKYQKPVTSTEVKAGLKRTSSPPQKLNSPDKLRKQESKMDDRLNDNFRYILNHVKPGMDQANRDAVDVWESQGTGALLQHIMTKEDGTPMSYAESRMMYG